MQPTARAPTHNRVLRPRRSSRCGSTSASPPPTNRTLNPSSARWGLQRALGRSSMSGRSSACRRLTRRRLSLHPVCTAVGLAIMHRAHAHTHTFMHDQALGLRSLCRPQQLARERVWVQWSIQPAIGKTSAPGHVRARESRLSAETLSDSQPQMSLLQLFTPNSE